VDSFVEDVLVNGKAWDSGEQEALTGSHIFVCAHNKRDRRCGVCGPALIEKLEVEIGARNSKDQIFVSACSHIGGHKYAGNLIIFSADSEGKIAGHWYGYVTPEDVPELLDQHVAKGVIIDRLWRGQMGLYVEKAEKDDEKKLPNGKEKKQKKEKIKEPLESNGEDKKENSASCCQGANGFSCCRDGTKDEVTIETQGKKGLGGFPTWMGKWEQSDVLSAAAVVGAVATIAVAYSLYRRSG